MCLQKGGVCKSFANAYILRLVCKRRLSFANAAILQTQTNIYTKYIRINKVNEVLASEMPAVVWFFALC